MAVANQATRSKILTILSPVGLFCVIIILILINNFIISAKIQYFMKNANFMIFFLDLLRFHYGFIIELWVGCAEPLAWLCPDGGGAEVRPEAWGGWVVRSFRPGSVPTEEGQRSGLKRGLCGWLGG